MDCNLIIVNCVLGNQYKAQCNSKATKCLRVSDLSLKDFPMPNLTEFLNIDLPKTTKKPSAIPRASDVVLPRNQWYYQYDKKPRDPSGSSENTVDREPVKSTKGLFRGDIVGATTLLAVLIAIDLLWFVHRMARTYSTSRMILYGCPVYIACQSSTDGQHNYYCDCTNQILGKKLQSS